MSLLTNSLLTLLAKNIDLGISPLRWIDLYAAQYIADCHSQNKEENNNNLVALAVLVSFVSSQGETYLSLSNLPKDILPANVLSDAVPDELIDNLVQSPAVQQVFSDSPSVFPVTYSLMQAPLILWQDRLYLFRYWSLHQQFEQWLQSRSKIAIPLEDGYFHPLAVQIKRVFFISNNEMEKESGDDSLNWQAISAAHTLLKKFSLITGGPGTGKTTAAASVLYLLMQRHQLRLADLGSDAGEARLSVRLLAPTGKAAIKLADSIQHHLLSIEARLLGGNVKSLRMSDCLPETGETIHRFLYEHGALRDSLNQRSFFNSDEILLGQKKSRLAKVDIIIIDEASMIDLALMVELIKVIPASTQVIMLGDHYQLPAVEPGQVFASCVQRYASYSYSHSFAAQLSRLCSFDEMRLRDESLLDKGVNTNEREMTFHPLCQLRKTYRFDGDLKTAAEQIKSGKSRAFKRQFLFQPSQEKILSVRWHAIPKQDNEQNDEGQTLNSMVDAYSDYFEGVNSNASLATLATKFEQFQLLCSTHEGPFGVIQMNDLIESRFVYQPASHKRYGSGLYHGKAILVTRNHPHLGIFNGDIGFVISTSNRSNLEIHFPINKQQSIVVAPGRLREWQPAYAMTVHKSQGSEYEHVGVVLADYAKELLSRPLLYTAVTRSKNECDIWAGSAALEKAFENG